MEINDVKKEERIQLRVSKDEKEKLKILALQNGMKLSQYIVWSLLYKNDNN